ncbi:hypothetical protein LAJ19_16025 (plasmid) [Deinococcus taeanensis]|uniref:hypothetical protein n=1 Tax=Deinococcus taeanensis TaxID=2737050 RepID=UPI001CDD42B2|nr:hypothetical protein [Deinococcus taeanensis]UBV44671.1 hypothetical protein LAJ19_16025 [Deinococcus taeanensis]
MTHTLRCLPRPRPLRRLMTLILTLVACTASAQTLRDPAVPYGSWGEAARETAAALQGVTLVKAPGGQYQPGDAVIYLDDDKRYRAHIVSLQNGRYEVHYDGFGPTWVTYADAQEILGYQPGDQGKASVAATRGFRVGDEVRAQRGGKWYDARIVAAQGGQFKVHFDGEGASADAWLTARNLAFFPGGPHVTAPLKPGKYACNTQSYDTASQMTVFNPKGSVVLSAKGSYQYLGFQTPSTGTFKTDSASRTVSFQGGHLSGGVATPMVQRLGRFYLTAPRIGERWACGAS